TFPRVHNQLQVELISELSLVLRWPGLDPALKPVLMMAHYDVVPVEGQEWTKEPFGGAVEGDFIYGRGAVDDKSSVMGLLEAAEVALKNGFKPKRDLYFVFGHDEEVGGTEGAQVVAEVFKQRGLEFEFILDEGGIITEGSKLGIPRNVALIGIAEKGYSDLELTITGTPGHSSMPPESTTIGRLARAIRKVEGHPFPASLDGVFSQTLEALIPHASLFQKWALSNLWLTAPLVESKLAQNPTTNAFIRTAQSVTMIKGGTKANVLPAEAKANLNLRLLPGDRAEWAKKRVSRLVAEYPEIEVRQANPGFVNEASAVSPTRSQGYELISAAIVKLDPSIVPIPYLVLGATDSRHYRDLSPNIYRFLFASLFADEVSRLHGIDERIR
ncbi:MAG: M20/M25/M40 family metallo-hydrolase, partial [Bdellovibrionales bacterium]|nr:M20/M25/M40 family metallo-hydrolase [Bdellovibrionales bacterium]